MAVKWNYKMKKTKQEAERDLLAKNHRRLNKAINELLDENKALRKRMELSLVRIAELQEQIKRKNDETRIAVVHTVVHALAGHPDYPSAKLAERALYIADAIQQRLTDIDNGP